MIYSGDCSHGRGGGGDRLNSFWYFDIILALSNS